MTTAKPLNTLELDKILTDSTVTRQKYLGAFPSCVHPKTQRRSYAFISNTDRHHEDGQHWCAWVIKNDTISFFDSFGRGPRDPSFPHNFQNIVKDFKHVQYTNTRIQNWTSKTCGYFCVHFIYILSLGLEYEDFLREYSNDYLSNDLIVIDFLNSITYICVSFGLQSKLFSVRYQIIEIATVNMHTSIKLLLSGYLQI